VDPDDKRTDSVVRHMHRHHADKSQYTGYNELTGYTFTPVSDDYPHIVMATRASGGTTLGYCTQCFTGFYVKGIINPVTLAKHFKTHTCAEKQTRTRKVVVKSEDASGNVTVKTEMQTGGVKITEEMIKSYLKEADMKYMGYETNETCDIDVQLTLETVFRDSSKLRSPAMKAALSAKPAEPVVTHVAEGEINWETICKDLARHGQIKRYMTEAMAEERSRVSAGVLAALEDPEADVDELDWYNFLVVELNKAKLQKNANKQVSDLKRQCGDLEDAADRERSRATRLELQLQQECQAAARREQERDEEIRNLRAALQQCQSKIELVVDDKKF